MRQFDQGPPPRQYDDYRSGKPGGGRGMGGPPQYQGRDNMRDGRNRRGGYEDGRRSYGDQRRSYGYESRGRGYDDSRGGSYADTQRVYPDSRRQNYDPHNRGPAGPSRSLWTGDNMASQRVESGDEPAPQRQNPAPPHYSSQQGGAGVGEEREVAGGGAPGGATQGAKTHSYQSQHSQQRYQHQQHQQQQHQQQHQQQQQQVPAPTPPSQQALVPEPAPASACDDSAAVGMETAVTVSEVEQSPPGTVSEPVSQAASQEYQVNGTAQYSAPVSSEVTQPSGSSALPQADPALPQADPTLPQADPTLPQTVPALPQTVPALVSTQPAEDVSRSQYDYSGTASQGAATQGNTSVSVQQAAASGVQMNGESAAVPVLLQQGGGSGTAYIPPQVLQQFGGLTITGPPQVSPFPLVSHVTTPPHSVW